jgi:8-oxo-dGTP pyrophosphatase MutT (NUDIX family)
MHTARWKPSATVAAIVERDGRFLLVEELTAQGLMLNNPAGHLDPGEAPEAACVREVLEETTFAFTPQALVGVYLSRSRKPTAAGRPRRRAGETDGLDDTTYLRIAYCGTVGANPVPGAVLDGGIVGTVWLTPEEIRASQARHRSPLLLAGLEDYLAGRRFPLDLVHTHPSVFATGG